MGEGWRQAIDGAQFGCFDLHRSTVRVRIDLGQGLNIARNTSISVFDSGWFASDFTAMA